MLIHEYVDDMYPCQGFTHTRITARAIVLNDQGEIGLIHIKGRDVFGMRNHYELPGGGIERGEDREAALKREIEEELGLEVSVDAYLGLVINRYNLLKVITAHHIFVATVTGISKANLTDFEKTLFEGVRWELPEVWLEILKEQTQGVNHLIHQREYDIIKSYINSKSQDA